MLDECSLFKEFDSQKFVEVKLPIRAQDDRKYKLCVYREH